MRMNLAVPKGTLDQALTQLLQAKATLGSG
jgi:hypothetical protein